MGDEKESDKLMPYFMGQTNERLVQIESKLMELLAFRSEVLASARTTSVLISAVSGIVILLVSYGLKKLGVS